MPPETTPANDEPTPEELGRALRLLADTIDPQTRPRTSVSAPTSFGERLAARRARAAGYDGTGGDGQDDPSNRRRPSRRQKRPPDI